APTPALYTLSYTTLFRSGAKWDAQTINEGLEVNENWDALWDVKARITDAGWYAEIAIPFRTLRFSSADEQTWGINFQRRIRRRKDRKSTRVNSSPLGITY